MIFLIFTLWTFGILAALEGEAFWTLVLIIAGGLFIPLIPAEKK